MRVIFLLVVFCAIGIAKRIPRKYKVDDREFLEKELNVLKLLQHINQPTHHKEFIETARSYHPETNLDQYRKPEWVQTFMHYYKHDILPKGQIFSIFDDEHLQQAISLFKMFYYAKTYETFFKTAVWARVHVNEGMFLYAFSVAIVHRDDTHGFILPPVYELYPYYFFNSEVIYKAQYYKQVYHNEYPSDGYGWKGWTIDANYSGWYLNLNPEQQFSYFTEDIGLNAFYYYYHIHYPWWMDNRDFNLDSHRRGELFYTIHQHLLAKYYNERLSNNVEPLAWLDEYRHVAPAYYPSLEYPNGLNFPARPANASYNWDNHFKIQYNLTETSFSVLDLARHIRDALDLGFVYTKSGEHVPLYDKHGLEVLANIIEGNPESPNLDFYGILHVYVRHVAGYPHNPLHKHKLVPSVLEHYETSLRDPVFWKFTKMIVDFFQLYKSHQGHYTEHDLAFPGVEIKEVRVDRLITYFDWFYSDLSNAVYYNHEEQAEPFHVRARQPRLNHLPFTYIINVKSDKPVYSGVHVYIGPKYDTYGRTIDINENRMYFYLIDHFTYPLIAGENYIARNSEQSFYIEDKTTYWQLYKQLMGTIKGNETFAIDGSETYFGIPKRLLLPKGNHEGMTYQFYVILTQHEKPVTTTELPQDDAYTDTGFGDYLYDNTRLGFPFDKPIDQSVFYVSNSYFQDVIIYHKKYEEVFPQQHD